MASRAAQSRRDKWDARKKSYLHAAAGNGRAVTLDARRGARWATGPRGVVAVLGASEAAGGGRWFLGINEREFHQRNAIGVLLLCEQGQQLLDFAIPAERLRELLGRLSKVGNERKINLVRIRDRYVLQVPGSEAADITDTLGNVSVLGLNTGRKKAKKVLRERTFERRFFAKVRRGRLEPIDVVQLEEGEVLLIKTERVSAAPGHASLRHIATLAASSDLPSDLASQHDHYAHGTPRR